MIDILAYFDSIFSPRLHMTSPGEPAIVPRHCRLRNSRYVPTAVRSLRPSCTSRLLVLLMPMGSGDSHKVL